jgi:lycopene cyclase domain-containing protein
MTKYTYLAIDLLSVAFPFLASFEHRVRFWKKWRGLFLGIFIMSLIFIPWDIIFTAKGIWGFNERYLIGFDIAGLPLEEWLFFVLIPYACMFLYEVMRHFVPEDVLGPYSRQLSAVIVVVLFIVGFMHLQLAYTSITFIATALFLAYHAFVAKNAWLGRFFIGYAVSLIPFFLVNGLLTGSWLEEPIVWYDNTENLGIRMGTIPLEDSIYLMLLLLIVTTFYERALDRSHG